LALWIVVAFDGVNVAFAFVRLRYWCVIGGDIVIGCLMNIGIGAV
jgi:hypothetical protein